MRAGFWLTRMLRSAAETLNGGVALSVGGPVRLAGVISQGCTPIGETWTLTRVQQNLIEQIANRPAYQVLVDTVEKLSPDEQKRARGNLFAHLLAAYNTFIFNHDHARSGFADFNARLVQRQFAGFFVEHRIQNLVRVHAITLGITTQRFVAAAERH